VGSTGLEALEFLPGGRGLRLFGSADLGAINKLDGIISSFEGESLSVSGAGLEVAAGHGGDGPRLSLTPDMVKLEGVHDFSVINPVTGEVLFSTSDPELALPDGLEKLEVEEAEVERITAPVGEDLLIRSERDLVVRGAEGVEVRPPPSPPIRQVGGSHLSLTSASDILLASASGAVELAGAVRLDAVMLPHGGGGFSVSGQAAERGLTSPGGGGPVQALRLPPQRGAVQGGRAKRQPFQAAYQPGEGEGRQVDMWILLRSVATRWT
jgi:hypothetical protein